MRSRGDGGPSARGNTCSAVTIPARGSRIDDREGSVRTGVLRHSGSRVGTSDDATGHARLPCVAVSDERNATSEPR